MAVDKKWIVNLQGKDYVTWPGVLAAAHERGIESLDTALVQIPAPDNEYTAIVRATVRLKDGSAFTDYGDASPRNTNAKIATALIRMASTRAKGRALRDAVNIGETMVEELPPDEVEERQARGERREARGRGQAPGSRLQAPGSDGKAPSGSFEETWADTGVGGTGKTYRRAHLLHGFYEQRSKAEQLGIATPQENPERMCNEALLEHGKALAAQVKARLAVVSAEAEDVASFREEAEAPAGA